VAVLRKISKISARTPVLRTGSHSRGRCAKTRSSSGEGVPLRSGSGEGVPLRSGSGLSRIVFGNEFKDGATVNTLKNQNRIRIRFT
jgi:hypothetical protein